MRRLSSHISESCILIFRQKSIWNTLGNLKITQWLRVYIARSRDATLENDVIIFILSIPPLGAIGHSTEEEAILKNFTQDVVEVCQFYFVIFVIGKAFKTF